MPDDITPPSYVSPDGSWLHYEIGVRYEEDGGVIRHKPLAGTLDIQAPPVDPLGDFADVLLDTSEQQLYTTADTPDILQQVSSPSGRVILEGQAVRFVYRIPIPALVQWKGQPAGQPVYRRIVQRPLMNVAGWPVWGLVFKIHYLIATPPQAIPMPANPILGLDGDGAE